MKDLNRNTRGVNHYLHLKSDFENDYDRLFNSLPLFFRIMYLDQPNPWINQINRFDFIRLATLSSEFISYQKIKIGDFEYKKINPTNKKDIIEVGLSEFFSSSVLSKKTTEFTIHEFILCLAYNGGIHMSPDKNEEKINILYEELFLKFPEFCFEYTKSISKVFIDIYDELYSLSVGNNHAHSSNINFQPKIIENGKMLDGILFEKAYMQLPIRAKKNKGIRFFLDVKTKAIPQKSPMLTYGHRMNDGLKASIWQQGPKLIFKVSSHDNNKTIVIDIEKYYEQFISIELAIYPNGKISISINEILQFTEDLKQEIQIIDGKVILGSNLDGNEFGNFFEKAIVVQSIDKTDNIRNLGVYALRKLNINPQRLAYNIIERKI
jgi:hypothetical protein